MPDSVSVKQGTDARCVLFRHENLRNILMKKLLSLFAVFTFCFAVIGCGGASDPGAGEEAEDGTASTEDAIEEAGMSDEEYQKAMEEEMKQQ
ncbi:MAG: hypothetical protein Fues2KO_40570 [Fuerstiella sp.]